jgi:enoyl-CoA hydratase/carnithine racemase
MKDAYGDHVKVALDGHVAVITLDRPPHNFVSVDFMRDLADAMDAVDADPQARAIVMQAAGKSFSAGADFAATDDAVASGMDGVGSLYDQAIRLYSVTTPIIAAINGAAIGAGLGLALLADFRIVSPEARFAANFVKLGFHPGFGISYALPRIVGEQKAALMLLTGRRIKGDEAFAWGLADELAPPEGVNAAALRLAAEIAENAPLAVVSTRATLRAGLADAIKARTAIEHREQSALRSTEDFAEGVKSVAERRPGNFAGR